MAAHGGAIEEAEHTAHLLVEFARAHLSLGDELLVGTSQIVGIVGIGGTHGEAIGPGAKLHVEAVGDGLLGVVATAPVADDHAVEAPVVLQDGVEHRGVMAVVLVVVEVIGSHDGPRPTLLHGGTEGRKINLVQGTVADDDVHLVTILLVVVQGVVLHTGGHPFRLQPLHIRHHHLRCQQGVFAHILKVATVEGCAVDVYARPQHHALAAIKGLLA